MKPRSISDARQTRKELHTPEFEERIRRRAYELYEERGGTTGCDMDDWLRAEAELTGKVRAATAN